MLRWMEGTESVLQAIYEEEEDEGGEEETLDEGGLEDVEMLDAETLAGSPAREADRPAGGGDGGHEAAEGGSRGKNQMRRANKKKNKKKKRKSGSAPNIMDINRFVIDTCRHLKEKKSYLVWNAVGCLGVSVVSELVKEVDTIQGCGRQRTADGKRFRTGGGILWNILKTREPKAYKEIMARGREFEKQFWQPKKEATPRSASSPGGAGEGEVTSSPEQGPKPSDSNTCRISALERIRAPVSYDDLFEEENKLKSSWFSR